mgnify:CR=1 FL=1
MEQINQEIKIETLVLTKLCPVCQVIKTCEENFYKVLKLNKRTNIQHYRTECKSCANHKRNELIQKRTSEGVIRKQQVYIKVSDPHYVVKQKRLKVAKEKVAKEKIPKEKKPKEKKISTAPPIGQRHYKFYKLPKQTQDYIKYLKFKKITPINIFRILKIPNEVYTNVKYMINLNLPVWNPEDEIPEGLEILLSNNNITLA